MITVLNDSGQLDLDSNRARAEGDALWLNDETVTAVSGWTIKPEGLCQGDMCVPVPRHDTAHFVADGQTNIAAFWRLLGRPVLHDDGGAHWLLASSAGERAATLASLTAPDFELPDIDGQLHRLSDYRGQRVFLTTWSSW
jgi:hypothetical protein